MDQKFVVAIASAYFRANAQHKALAEKQLLPLGDDAGFLRADTDIQVKFRGSDGTLVIAESATLQRLKDTFCLRLPKDRFDAVVVRLDGSDYTFIVAEGSFERATAILHFCRRGDDDPFSILERENPALRLPAFDLPPAAVTVVDAPTLRPALYALLAKTDPELFSLRTQRFLRTPHILTQLFSHVMGLDSGDHIAYVSTLRVIADQLRLLLLPRIRKVEKDHQALWSTFYGERLSFLDGGVSRIVSLPGTEPTGVRVGIYTVTPGERDLEKRESWELQSYAIGDVISDRSMITEEGYQTDAKRFQEAARYILESLTALTHLRTVREQPRLFLLHGPLQYPFETYDEADPYYIPGVSKEFLRSVGITKDDVGGAIADLPADRRGQRLWNGCIPIYLFIQQYLKQLSVPIAGVVERGRSISFATAVLNSLVAEGVIPPSTGNKLRNRIERYEMGDEFLFGCILEEGEYLAPLPLRKNIPRRAHDRWEPVVAQFPAPMATMIKCSAANFPYRVEMPVSPNPDELHRLMSLLYHMSALLPDYAFPVGIDIADKYAHIPDWLSKGVSARLTAVVLNKVLETGDPKQLLAVRRLLALSPRDFFFRPRA